jgi:hypothetical protein
VDVPLPGGLACALAISIFATADRIIDNAEVGAAAGDRTANPGGEIFSARFGLPLADRLPIGSDTNAKNVTVCLRGDEIADPSPEPSHPVSVGYMRVSRPRAGLGNLVAVGAIPSGVGAAACADR